MSKIFQEFRKDVMWMTSAEAARDAATAIFVNQALPDKLNYILAGSSINPYFVPHLPPELGAGDLMSAAGLQKAISFARAAAANTRSHRIFYSSAPKTGSTFVSAMLSRVLGINRVTLTLNSTVPSAQTWFGGGLNEQDIDESALLIHCMAASGFVAHNHMLCSPLTASLLGIYGVKSIVTARNIFDTLVSFDDHFMKVIPKSEENTILRHGMPTDYTGRDFVDRISVLIDMKLSWYLKYYMSWQTCERQGLIKPLWIVYERDILGPKQALAEKVHSHLDLPEAMCSALIEALSETGTEQLNVNKGVAGRGAAITGANRDRILEFFSRYDGQADFSDIVQ